MRGSWRNRLGLGHLLAAAAAAVPLEILQKPGPLDDDEFAEIRKHPESGRRLLDELGGFRETVRRLVSDHHERLDGTGYPRGLQAATCRSRRASSPPATSTTRSSPTASTARHGRPSARSRCCTRSPAPASTRRSSRRSSASSPRARAPRRGSPASPPRCSAAPPAARPSAAPEPPRRFSY
jgi:HD domain